MLTTLKVRTEPRSNSIRALVLPSPAAQNVSILPSTAMDAALLGEFLKTESAGAGRGATTELWEIARIAAPCWSIPAKSGVGGGPRGLGGRVRRRQLYRPTER